MSLCHHFTPPEVTRMDQLRHYQSQSAHTHILRVYLKSTSTNSPASSTLETRAHGFTELWRTQKGGNTWSLFCHQQDCCNVSVAVRYLIAWLMKPYVQKINPRQPEWDTLSKLATELRTRRLLYRVQRRRTLGGAAGTNINPCLI